MGGFGSGRQGYKPKAEDLRSIDANRLRKAGHLRDGHCGGWKWWHDDVTTGSISTRCDHGQLVLEFTVSGFAIDAERIVQPIVIDWQPCHFGGYRAYFVCPAISGGRACNRRVGKLFFGGRKFHCRHCLRVAYASQSEDALDRALRAADKHRAAIKADLGVGSLAPKPKGMHWATYARHIAAIDAADDLAERAFIAFANDRFSRDLGDLLE